MRYDDNEDDSGAFDHNVDNSERDDDSNEDGGGVDDNEDDSGAFDHNVGNREEAVLMMVTCFFRWSPARSAHQEGGGSGDRR